MSVKSSLKLYRATWGCLNNAFGNMTMSEFLPKVKQLGYTGIEIPYVLALDYDPIKLIDELEENNLNIIFQLFSDGPVAPGHNDWTSKLDTHKSIKNGYHPIPNEINVDTHINVLKKQIEQSIEYFNNSKRLTKLNCHSLRDFHTIKEATKFFDEMISFQNQILKDTKLSDDKGVSCILHETHRKRFFHSPWTCRDFFNSTNYEINDLLMTADLSHFTCVAETDPNTHPCLTDVIKNLSIRIKHIHGRIGYDHGPQVNDPRAPEWIEYVNGFENWWDIILEKQINSNINNKNKDKKNILLTLTPEHGPPNYQNTLPYTLQPVADIWDINTWVGERQIKRFNQKFSEKLTK